MENTIETRVKFWATFYTPGSFVCNTCTQDMREPDPHKVEWPPNAYAFTLNAREELIKDGKVYLGEVLQVGPLYYHPDSKVESLEEARANPASTDILIQNMEINKWDYIVWSRWGNWPQPFDPNKDQILLHTAPD